jgi:hypothetical protein
LKPVKEKKAIEISKTKEEKKASSSTHLNRRRNTRLIGVLKIPSDRILVVLSDSTKQQLRFYSMADKSFSQTGAVCNSGTIQVKQPWP